MAQRLDRFSSGAAPRTGEFVRSQKTVVVGIDGGCVRDRDDKSAPPIHTGSTFPLVCLPFRARSSSGTQAHDPPSAQECSQPADFSVLTARDNSGTQPGMFIACWTGSYHMKSMAIKPGDRQVRSRGKEWVSGTAGKALNDISWHGNMLRWNILIIACYVAR